MHEEAEAEFKFWKRVLEKTDECIKSGGATKVRNSISINQ